MGETEVPGASGWRGAAGCLASLRGALEDCPRLSQPHRRSLILLPDTISPSSYLSNIRQVKSITPALQEGRYLKLSISFGVRQSFSIQNSK